MVELSEDKVRKTYTMNSFQRAFLNQEQIVLKLLSRNFTTHDGGIVIDRVVGLNDETLIQKNISAIAKKIEEFHMLDTTNVEYQNYKDSLELFNYKFENEDDIINQALVLQKQDVVLCHGDLVTGNILFNVNEIEFIDFEYSGKSNRLFDLASFITERKLSQEQEDEFVSSFMFEVNLDDLEIIKKFLRIFWGKWAYWMHEQTGKQIYLDILEDKKKDY